jgi:hypothetical protein
VGVGVEVGAGVGVEVAVGVGVGVEVGVPFRTLMLTEEVPITTLLVL